MKVMMVAPYFYPRVGGLENYVYNISKLLIQRYGISVTVVCSTWGKEGYKKESIECIKVYRLPYLFKVSSTPINPGWYGKLASIIYDEDPDIINGHIPVPYIADIAARIAYRKRIPFILTYHNDLVGRNIFLKLLSSFYYYWLGFKTLKISQKIIVTSKYYAEGSPYLSDFYDKLEVAPVGVDIGRFDVIQDTPPKTGRKVLFIGQLDKSSQHKGLDYLMKAIKTVSERIEDVELVVIGQGDYVDHYRKLGKTLGIQSKVDLAGFVPDSDLPKCYNQADVTVLPSYNRSEGCGIVLLESQACKVPAIGTNVGGIPYAIREGETGLLVPPKNSNALAHAITRLLEDKEFAQRLGENGYRRVRREFTWDKSAGKTLKVYRKVAQDSEPKRKS